MEVVHLPKSTERGRIRRRREGIHDSTTTYHKQTKLLPPVKLSSSTTTMVKQQRQLTLQRLCILLLLLLLLSFVDESLQWLPSSIRHCKNYYKKKQQYGLSQKQQQPCFDWYRSTTYSSKQSATVLFSTLPTTTQGWYPKPKSVYYFDDDISNSDIYFDDDDDDDDYINTGKLEERIVQLTAKLVRNRISNNESNNNTTEQESTHSKERITESKLYEQTKKLVQGRFMDLTCTRIGEKQLESLFWQSDEQIKWFWQDIQSISRTFNNESQTKLVYAVILVLQSLCIMGTQVGVLGTPEQLRKQVAHLKSNDDNNMNDIINDNSYFISNNDIIWDNECVRKLKYKLDKRPAIQLLAILQVKRNPQGAFDLLNSINAWTKHEDLALLRSGFPIRFTYDEEQAALNTIHKANQQNRIHDPDTILNIRKDLRHLKVYTIDAASTSEIDDGLSVEELPTTENGIKRQRIWVHIADADLWAPRNTTLFEAARKRITSLYLPSGSISMFPSRIASTVMSLKANNDISYALSLGVELNDNDDGSINLDSIIVTPSIINVSYRLTYDDVDEMLEEGIAYKEEWELGALFVAATKRRNYRISNGSTEGTIPNPVPYASVSLYSDKNAPDGIGIAVNVQVSHNAAKNKTATAEDGDKTKLRILEEPVSGANLLVTEAMILAGETLGRWKTILDAEETIGGYENHLRLPFRTQRQPDYKARSRERKVMRDLLEYNVGNGLCHAWYSRRFLEPVRVTEMQLPHAGLGLVCYVQWSSPIRRFSDFQVHTSVKRYLRRQKVYQLIHKGEKIPENITSLDLGLPEGTIDNDGNIKLDEISTDILDQDIDYLEGIGLIGAARTLQKQSQQYWMYEYIRRLTEQDADTRFSAIVLGCVDPVKRQYAIFVKEIGLEHRYITPAGRLDPGDEIQLGVSNASPRSGLLSFVRVL